MCVWFWGYPHIIFHHLFLLFSHSFFFFFFFQDPINNRYLVDATPPRIFYRSFWNNAYLFYMVGRCSCSFGVILLLYAFKTHNLLLTKSWRRGTLAHNGLILGHNNYFLQIMPELKFNTLFTIIRRIRAATWGNVPSDMCTQWRFKSSCAFAQPDQNLHWAHLRDIQGSNT